MAAPRLQTREARKKLLTRDSPYYIELRRGLALGYRKGSEGGSWLLREFAGGRYVKRRLAAADDNCPGDGFAVLSWDEAQRLALGADRPTVTRPTKLTLAQAAESYFDARRGAGDHDKGTYQAFIAPTLGERVITELTTGDIEKWLSSHVANTTDKEKRRASQATANRRFSILRAILNSAYRKDPDRVPSDAAWRRVRSYANADKPRTRTLTADEARRLLNALEPSIRSLARGALYTGCRLGELQALTASDIVDGQVSVQHSKGGRPRTIPLSAEGLAFFEQTIAGLAADAPIFETISRIKLSRAMRTACGWRFDRKANKWLDEGTGAKISPPAKFHDLRRSYGSLLLNSGASADVIQELLGHADLRMTRRAYAHLLDRTKQRVVSKHLPSFGFEPKDTVVPLRRSRKA